MSSPAALPIDDALPELRAALTHHDRVVLAAPPGAGKTTRVPLDLLSHPNAGAGRIILLEPRRIAARMAAERMARQLDERVGQTIGLRTRLDTRVSDATRIEVVTDGVFTRRILSDPGLDGVSTVIFDEIHERALTADLGLALAAETQAVLRDDLLILLMSATLDTALYAERLRAAVVQSEGRAFPVETVYLGRDRDEPVDIAMARAVRRALRETPGSILCFLPGQRDIHRTHDEIDRFLPENVRIHALYGALSPAEQDAAVQPPPPGMRKVVLATDIAESALTIEGVTTVIDTGLARVPVTDAVLGTTRLVTRRAARANVDQRRGRAGRTAPGVCYRLWSEPETRGLAQAPEPEILTADLTGLVLDLADWGETDPMRLTWIDPPPAGRVAAARNNLIRLCLIDPDRRQPTDLGRRVARLPLSPRLGALVAGAQAGRDRRLAADIAALVSEPGLGGSSTDLATRLETVNRDGSRRAKAMASLARRWSDTDAAPASPAEAGRLIASAWPDRIAMARNRAAAPGQYLLASGQAARFDPTDPMAKHEWIVVIDMGGAAKDARISLATPLSEPEVRARIETEDLARYNPEADRVEARNRRKIGAITLSESPRSALRGEAARAAVMEAVQEAGLSLLPCKPVIDETLARIALLRSVYPENWPDWTEIDLLHRISDWLAPILPGSGCLADLTATEVRRAIENLLDWPMPRDLDRLAPRHIESPTGARLKIDYLDDKAPLVAARVQEVYGVSIHPTIADGRIPLTLSLLSPARREVALTADLPGFWAGGYHDMRKDMRGRYPKHDWPDDPASAAAHRGRVRRKG